MDEELATQIKMLFLFQANLAEEVGFTSLTVLHAAATSYVVNRLLPYTKYEFVVIPFQRGSPGAASALVEAFTMAVSWR